MTYIMIMSAAVIAVTLAHAMRMRRLQRNNRQLEALRVRAMANMQRQLRGDWQAPR